jgi:hypothetical protein
MSADSITQFQLAHGPVTFAIGLLEAEVDTVVRAYHAWTAPLYRSVHAEKVAGTLAALISQSQPMTAPPQKSLLIPTQSRWTAYFDNFIPGTDAFGPIGHLSDVLNCRGVIITCALGGRAASKPAEVAFDSLQFELFGPGADNPLGVIRSISVARDGGSRKFHATGAVQPFEETERYGQRLVAERFTPAMLATYASALGIDAFNETFYLPEATLVSYANVEPARQCTLAEARRECGLR